MTNLLQDLRFAVRSFLRAPRFTIPAVLALALGIGATSAIFSVVRGVMLKPLPYQRPRSHRHGVGEQPEPQRCPPRFSERWAFRISRAAISQRRTA